MSSMALSSSSSASSSSATATALASPDPSSPVVKRAKGEEETKPVLLFDVEMLVTVISLGLQDESSTTQVAETIAATTPDLLHSLIHCAPHQFTELFKNQPKDVQRTAQKLYTLSLHHSHYYSTLTKLEREISTYLQMSTKERFEAVINRAKDALSVKPNENLESYQTAMKLIGQATHQIEEALALFNYVDSEYRGRLVVLYANSFDSNDNPVFPECRKFYSTLCQNLYICRNEQAQLMQLRRALFARTLELQQKARSFYAPVESATSRTPFFNQHQPLLWEVGSELLKAAFWTTFAEKRKYKTFIPENFYNAVQQTAKINDWQKYSFKFFLNAAPDPLPVGFVENIWGTYSTANIADLGEWMSHLIHALPMATFEKLATEIKETQAKKELLLQTFEDYFKTQQKGSLTFPKLKSWCDNLRIPNKRKMIS